MLLPGRRLSLLVLCAALTGCSVWQRGEPANYRTIAVKPNRDTDRAKSENDRAVRMIENENLDRAEQHLQHALIADVTFGPAHNNLGRVYFCQGKNYLAAWEFEYAIKLMPDRAEPYHNLGLVYETVGKFDEAIEWYENGLTHEPQNPYILGNLARIRMRRNDKDPVIDHLLRELVANDSRPEWVNWAREQLALSHRAPGDVIPPGVETLPPPAPKSPSILPTLPGEPTANSSPRLPSEELPTDRVE